MAYDIFTLGVPIEWPDRLLHIPSMTSLERRPDNIYGEDKEPSYGIISYTWGRYEVPEGPHIEFHGIDWKTPSIREDHFTVAELIRLLQQINLKFENVWIDIACIDQKRHETKMQEIGKQASIFKCARKAYVWLNMYQPNVLSQHMQKLLQSGWQSAQDKNVEPARVAEEMTAALSIILQDRWFSSLWTLQESVLQRHAILLNKSGEPVETHGPWNGESPSTQVMDVSGACDMARQRLERAIVAEQTIPAERTQSPEEFRKLSEMRTMIDNSGINFTLCPNPIIAYAAARFRQTTHAVDRIYVIMQVFGYKLGDAAPSAERPAQGFTLEILELQFLQTLNAQSALLSQSFQHLEVPPPGGSWALTNSIRVPSRLHNMIVDRQFMSSENYRVSIRRRDEAYFQAATCTIQSLFEFLHKRVYCFIEQMEQAIDAPTELKPRADFFRPSRILKEAKQGIIADQSDRYDFNAISYEWPPSTEVYDQLFEPLIECRPAELRLAAERLQGIGKRLVEMYGEKNVRMLYLGRSKYIEVMDLGMVVVRTRLPSKRLIRRKREAWRRIGLAFWHQAGRREDEEALENAMSMMSGRCG